MDLFYQPPRWSNGGIKIYSEKPKVVGEKRVLVLIANMPTTNLMCTFVGSNLQLCTIILTSNRSYLRFAMAYGKT
jgi:hypothetical protein